MKRLLAVILAFSVNAYGAAVIPNIFATQPSGNVPASYLDVDFALISNYNTFSNYLVDSGVANVYVVTFPVGTTGSLAAGLLVNFKAGADNTGASTLAVNGMTAKNITNYDATALAAGQIKAGAIVSVIYDGTQIQVGRSTWRCCSRQSDASGDEYRSRKRDLWDGCSDCACRWTV